MTQLVLYYAPGSCSRVPLICLYEAGADFEPRLLKFMRGDSRSPAYLAQNPKGKVPLLLVDGEPLSENVAIQVYLARAFPAANLLPLTGEPLADARVLADLVWCASGLHPVVTRLRLPQFFCESEEGRKQVWAFAAREMTRNFAIIEERLKDRDWLYGGWSSLDAYLYWIWYRVTGAGFDASACKRYAAHAARMEARPSVQRTLRLEKEAEAILEKEGLAVNLNLPRPG